MCAAPAAAATADGEEIGAGTTAGGRVASASAADRDVTVTTAAASHARAATATATATGRGTTGPASAGRRASTAAAARAGEASATATSPTATTRSQRTRGWQYDTARDEQGANEGGQPRPRAQDSFLSQHFIPLPLPHTNELIPDRVTDPGAHVGLQQAGSPLETSRILGFLRLGDSACLANESLAFA